MERHLNLNGRDTSFIIMDLFFKWGVSVVFIAKELCWVSCIGVITCMYGAGVATIVNELHVILTSQR